MKQVPILSVLIAVLILISASTANAVSNAAVLYLRVAAGARPAGMGEAFVSIADDATATYWNPAGLGNAPVAGRQETNSLPPSESGVSGVVTLKSYNGTTQTWVIDGDELKMHDGKSWNTGRVYPTSSDQTLYDFLRTILNIEDEEKLETMAERVIAANCDLTGADIGAFVESVRANIPEGYAEMDELERGLDTLEAGFKMCLLNIDRFKSLRNKLEEGMKDSLLTGEELDKITYSLEQAVLRFLPSRLTVPYSSAITGRMICLGKTGSYLWVGTDNGLYRHSAVSWARYNKQDHGIPSDTILAMDEEEEHLLIGTTAGLVEYYHGSFNKFDNLPQSPATAIAFTAPDMGYAVVGKELYRYDGKKWFEGFSYTLRIDDNIDKIVERVAVYHTPSEYEYLEAKIRSLNAGNVPSQDKATVEPETNPADTLVMEQTDQGVEGDIETPEEEEIAGSEPWLVEGNVIQLPYSPQFRYEVTTLFADDVDNIVWVGTTTGLLSFDGHAWTRHGYQRFVVPGPDSAGVVRWMTAEDIATELSPFDDLERITTLTENIDKYNEMNGRPVESGEAVYVYNHNTGATIRSVGKVFGDLYVGTEHSLEKRTADGWETINIKNLESQHILGIYDFDGQAYFVAVDNLVVETKGRREFVVMFVKWLPTLDLDMYYGFLSYVHNARGLGTFGLSAIYLSYGSIEYRDEAGNYAGEGSPFEFSLALSYGTSVNSRFKLGGTVKMIHSHLANIGAGREEGRGIAWDFAVDAGLLFKVTDRMQFGSAISNLGPDITYIDADQADALPRNLAVGLSYKVWDSPYNRLVVQGELNKMLVDLNKGFNTELEYAIRHIGAEYWYSDFIAIRAGYKFDKEGEVKHLTFGAGLQYEAARFDLAYVPSSVDSPLANTLRISFSLML